MCWSTTTQTHPRIIASWNFAGIDYFAQTHFSDLVLDTLHNLELALKNDFTHEKYHFHLSQIYARDCEHTFLPTQAQTRQCCALVDALYLNIGVWHEQPQAVITTAEVGFSLTQAGLLDLVLRFLQVT